MTDRTDPISLSDALMRAEQTFDRWRLQQGPYPLCDADVMRFIHALREAFQPAAACGVVGYLEPGRRVCELPPGHDGYHQQGGSRWLGNVMPYLPEHAEPAPGERAPVEPSIGPQKFCKRPVVIEACHYAGTSASFDAVWEWMGGHDGPNGGYNGPNAYDPQSFDIKTLEGRMRADVGDWIICGVNGEFYPCKPDIFEKTYEPVSPTRAGAETPPPPVTGTHGAQEMAPARTEHDRGAAVATGTPERETPTFVERLTALSTFERVFFTERMEVLEMAREADAEVQRLNAELASEREKHDEEAYDDALATIDALAAKLAACAPYLKDDETPAECIERNRKDIDALMTLLAREKAQVETLTQQVETLTRERDTTYRECSNAARDVIATRDHATQRAEQAESRLADLERRVRELVETLRREASGIEGTSRGTDRAQGIRNAASRLAALVPEEKGGAAC